MIFIRYVYYTMYIYTVYLVNSLQAARMKLKFILKMYYNLCLRLHPVE